MTSTVNQNESDEPSTTIEQQDEVVGVESLNHECQPNQLISTYPESSHYY